MNHRWDWKQPVRARHRPLVPGCVLLLLAVFAPSLLFAQGERLSGRVLDAATGQPIVHALVCLLEPHRCAGTDEAGAFIFNDVSVGTYTLTVHHISWADQERRIAIGPQPSDLSPFLMQPSLLSGTVVFVRSARSDASLETVSIPTDVRSAEQLRRTPAVTIADALSRIPGVALARDGSWETAVTVRGMGPSNVVTVIDETRIESSTDIAGTLSLVNIRDLERAETIRSAGSVEYGTGAIGGVVHLMTKRPTFSEHSVIHGELSEEAGSVNDGISSFAALEGSSDNVAFRVSGGYRNAGNTMTPAGVLRNSQYRDLSFTAAVAARSWDDQSFRLTYQRAQAENTGIPGGAAFAATAAARFPLTRRELVEAEYDLPHPTAGVAEMTIRASHQVITRNVEIVQTPALTLTPHATHATSSIQVQSKITVAPTDVLTMGFDAWQRSLVSQRERRFTSKDSLVGERPLPDSRFFSAGIYAKNEWIVVPDVWSVTAGARYDGIRVTNEAVYQPEYIVTPSGARIIPAQQLLWAAGSGRNASWSVNLGSQVSLSTALEATVLLATAFRSPSLEERFQYLNLGAAVHVGDPALRPERSLCLNAGLRFHGEDACASCDLFWNRLTDLVAEVAGTYEGSPAFVKTNVGKAQLYGAEASLEYMPTSWSVVRSSVAYVRGEDLLAHVPLMHIPPLNGTMEVCACVPTAGTATIIWRAAATQDEIAAGELRTAGYAVVDLAGVSEPWTFGTWALIVRAGVQNLLNRDYRNHLSTLRGSIISEPGRNFSFGADISW